MSIDSVNFIATSHVDTLRAKMASMELDKENAYRQIEKLDQSIAKLRKKIDLVLMLGSGLDSEDLINSIIGSENNNSDGTCIVAAPAAMSMNMDGHPGQILYDTQFLYICVDVNTWRRSPLVMWSQK